MTATAISLLRGAEAIVERIIKVVILVWLCGEKECYIMVRIGVCGAEVLKEESICGSLLPRREER